MPRDCPHPASCLGLGHELDVLGGLFAPISLEYRELLSNMADKHEKITALGNRNE